jgi:leucyl-tRNA synthetase
MEFTNALYDAQQRSVSDEAFNEALESLLLMLAPVAPFMAEELWSLKGRSYSVHQQPWPAYNEAFAADEVITLVLQVNGKVRGRLTMPVNLNEDQAHDVALKSEAVQRHLKGQTPKRVVYVPGKLVNVVV